MTSEFNIGILRETQINPDARTALTPHGAAQLLQDNKALNIYVQPSDDRAFADEEYAEVGCVLMADLSHCDVLLGVKEVAKESLIEGKQYMFFSHTAKKQMHNQALLQTILDKKITLIDYEYLYASKKNRIAAFGYYAGLAGAYNTMRAYGLKYKRFNLLSLHEIKSQKQMMKELKKKVVGRQDKILITGKGRVSKGIEEVMQTCGIFKVEQEDFLTQRYNDPVYYVASPLDYAKHKDDIPFTFKDYRTRPRDFVSNFNRFAQVTDILITGHYWDTKSPKFFNIEDISADNFNIKLIGDITCDVDGSVPTTQKTCTIEESYYDIIPATQQVEKAFSAENNITVMAVDKLPSAIPKEASEFFSEQLVNHVLGYFWMGDYNKVLKKATIAKNGKIKKRFNYLRSFVQEKL
ncbi:NAD(P)-dependent oxidoreductase [Labilibacter marinus]|uniref:NAD(P)-dependent oxidoreductase n=1 Tax=Labilibacter marinus TaxID=1477105 RepID=UPI00082D05AC|nr:NAD(P)-dependent oxidoreductase [Labilibacter marinus]